MALKDKYINLFTDFGFKRVFGEEANKDLLLDFLNQVLPTKYTVQDLFFSKNEHVGTTVEDRKAIFDIYCVAKSGERFIVELQKARQDYFKDRSIYYASFPIQEMAKRGKWDYKLQTIFTVGILNFTFKDHENDKNTIRHHVQLKDQNCQVFYKKLHFIYLELPKFNKKLQDCKNRYEKWLWIFKNLPDLNQMPKELQENIFTKLFNISEIANFNNQERAAYEQSLKYLRDIHNVVDTAEKKGRREGRREGKMEEKNEGIKTMLAMEEFSVDLVAKIFKVSVEYVKAIEEELKNE